MKEYKYKINGNKYSVTITDIEDNTARVEVNGAPFTVEMEKKAQPVMKPLTTTRPAKPTVQVATPVVKEVKKSGVKSPLPGVILDIKVKEGDMVKKGQTIVILEAMKMENNIHSDRDGKVTSINVGKGESVLEGADLIFIE